MTVRRALALSFLDRYVGFTVNFVSSMVLARLLTPAELGVYSVVMVLSGFVAVFRDMGAGQYMVRHPNLTPEVMRRTFTLQLSMGVLLAVLVAAAAAPLARFYGEPRMEAVCWVLAANFLVTPFSAYPVAWLTRELQFGHLAWTRAVGAVAGAGMAIGMVLLDYGPVSLAWGNLATTVAGLALLHLVARPPLPWRPLWRGLKEALAFGGGMTAVSLVSSLRVGLPELMVGRMLGLSHAGYLSRGQSLCSTFEILVMGAVGPVILPFIARAQREGRPLGPLVSRALALLCGVGWPFFAMLALLAQPLIFLLFGDQWGEAVAPARWLALSAAAFLPLSVLSAALVAVGRIQVLMAVHAAAALAVGLGLLMGVGNGLASATAGMALMSCVNTLCCLLLLRKPLALTAAEMLKPLAQALGLSLGACALPAALVWQLPGQGYSGALLLCGLAGVAALACGLALAFSLQHPLWLEIRRRRPA